MEGKLKACLALTELQVPRAPFPTRKSPRVGSQPHCPPLGSGTWNRARCVAGACAQGALGRAPSRARPLEALYPRASRRAAPCVASPRRALRPHAEAAGRRACALASSALSPCAGLWSAGSERRPRGGSGAARRSQSAGGQWVCARPIRSAGSPSAVVPRWERNRKTRAKTGSPWLGPHGGGRRGPPGREGPFGAGWTRVEARGQPRGAPGLGPEWEARV